MFEQESSNPTPDDQANDRVIDPNQVVPLYHQIYLILREQILEGRYSSQPLPGELVLAEQFNVSRVTMRRALQDLVKEGLIARGRGKGTFVKPRRDNRPLSDRNIASLLSERSDNNGLSLMDVLEVTRVSPPPDILDALLLNSRDFVQKTVRVRSDSKQPIAYLTSYMPESIAQNIGRRDLQHKSIETLLEESGIQVVKARQSLSARLADSAVASVLNMPVGAPLLAVTRIAYTHNDRPVELLRALYRPDKMDYHLALDSIDSNGDRVWIHRESPDQ